MNHDIDRTQVGFGSEVGGTAPHSGGAVFNPDTHANLAADLLDVKSEQELEYFLGDVISGAAHAVGKFISSPTGQALGSGLKDVAKQVLPVAATAVGDYFGGPTGGQIGGALGSGWPARLRWNPRSSSGRQRTRSSSWLARLRRTPPRCHRTAIRMQLRRRRSSKRPRFTRPAW